MKPGNEKNYDYMAKLLILGDSGVGKTNVLMKLCDNNFNPSHLTTIGIDFKIKMMEVDGKKIKMQIWDTAGQERFQTITQTYYKGSMGIVLAYSITDRNSFESIQKWMNQINQFVTEKICKVLIGNKCDINDQRVVSEQEGQDLANEFDVPFFETSALSGINIDQCFQKIAQEVYQKLQSQSDKQDSGTKKLENNNKKQSSSTCC